MSTTAFPLVEMSGSPRERGRMHGVAVPGRIALSVELYREQLVRRGVAANQLADLARALLPKIEAYDADYLEEMMGVAEGAGRTIEEIVLVNCRTEMMFGHGSMASSYDALDTLEEGCTGFIVMPQAAHQGRLMHCHNWDWREQCADTGVVLRIRRTDGPDVLTFAEAGGLMRHGFNDAGVSLTGNFLLSDRDFKTQADVPLILLRRKMLESGSLASAMRVAWNSRRFCSNNLMLGQALANGDAEAVDLECAPDEIFWNLPENDVLVHANHWLAPSAKAKLVDRTLVTEPDSTYRQRRVEAGLAMLKQQRKRVDWNHARDILGDAFGTPDAVLCAPKPAAYDSVCITVATTLMDPADKRMWIAPKPYAPHEYTEYCL